MLLSFEKLITAHYPFTALLCLHEIRASQKVICLHAWNIFAFKARHAFAQKMIHRSNDGYLV